MDDIFVTFSNGAPDLKFFNFEYAMVSLITWDVSCLSVLVGTESYHMTIVWTLWKLSSHWWLGLNLAGVASLCLLFSLSRQDMKIGDIEMRTRLVLSSAVRIVSPHCLRGAHMAAEVYIREKIYLWNIPWSWLTWYHMEYSNWKGQCSMSLELPRDTLHLPLPGQLGGSFWGITWKIDRAGKEL